MRAARARPPHPYFCHPLRTWSLSSHLSLLSVLLEVQGFLSPLGLCSCSCLLGGPFHASSWLTSLCAADHASSEKLSSTRPPPHLMAASAFPLGPRLALVIPHLALCLPGEMSVSFPRAGAMGHVCASSPVQHQAQNVNSGYAYMDEWTPGLW